MNKIFTLLTGVFCLYVTTATAQIHQDFENATSYTNNCWSFNGFFVTSVAGEVLTGQKSLYANPSTNGSSSRDIITPYLNISNTSFTVSFSYKLSNALNGSAERRIEIGLLDVNSSFTSLHIITLNRNTPGQTSKNTFAQTFTLTTTSVQRLVFKLSGDHGDGNTRVIMDDLMASANTYYSPSNCNTAPVAVSNIYNAPSTKTPYTGVSVLNNDSDPNSESLTASLAAQSLDGTVVMNPDGTFTFTPSPTFAGSFTTFTYIVRDNGYDRMSATASVSIYFPQVTALPLQLLQFAGKVNKDNVNVSWSVAANETGLLFEVQRSSNGTAYQSIATVFTTEKNGDEQYQFTDVASKQTTHYRLKLVNKDGTVSYSNVISFEAIRGAGKIVLLQNPVQATLRFKMPATAAAIKSITIYSASGAVVSTQKPGMSHNNNNISISLPSSMPAGMYILEVVTGTGSQSTTFIKH